MVCYQVFGWVVLYESGCYFYLGVSFVIAIVNASYILRVLKLGKTFSIFP